MKKLVLLSLGAASLVVTSLAQGSPAAPTPAPATGVQLEIVNDATTGPLVGVSTETVVSGNSFTVDIDVQDPNLQDLAEMPPPALYGFDLTLATLPTGITLTSFTPVLSTFVPYDNSPSTQFYSTGATTGGQIPITATQTVILQATFSTAATLPTGSYTIDFDPPGLFQLLDANSTGSSTYSYTDDALTLYATEIPEPTETSLLLTGLVVLLGFGAISRRSRLVG